MLYYLKKIIKIIAYGIQIGIQTQAYHEIKYWNE